MGAPVSRAGMAHIVRSWAADPRRTDGELQAVVSYLDGIDQIREERAVTAKLLDESAPSPLVNEVPLGCTCCDGDWCRVGRGGLTCERWER
jgi:hypothetical protein